MKSNSGRSFNFNDFEAIVLGGSSGSVKFVMDLLRLIPYDFPLPIIMALHRPPDQATDMCLVLSKISKINVIEPDTKLILKKGTVYIAPSDFHLVIEQDKSVNIDKSPLVQFSRPSIDVLFMSASDVFKKNLIGILITGSNKDGAFGMKTIRENGGMTIVQNPIDSTVPRMPQAAIDATQIDYIARTEEIYNFFTEFYGKFNS